MNKILINGGVFLLMTLVGCSDSTVTDRQNNDESTDRIETQVSDATTVNKKPTVEMKFEKSSIEDIMNNVPEDIHYKGELVHALQWKDANGENILVNSTRRKSINETADLVLITSQLYSLHYLKKGNKYELLSETVDREIDCDLDLTLEFKTEPIIVDSDNNGVAEVIIAYAKTCRGDISPAGFKVLLHENNKKYGLRGYEFLLIPGGITLDENFNYDSGKVISKKGDDDLDNIGEGRFFNDHDFKNAPPAFLIEAKMVWIQNVVYKL